MSTRSWSCWVRWPGTWTTGRTASPASSRLPRWTAKDCVSVTVQCNTVEINILDWLIGRQYLFSCFAREGYFIFNHKTICAVSHVGSAARSTGCHQINPFSHPTLTFISILLYRYLSICKLCHVSNVFYTVYLTLQCFFNTLIILSPSTNKNRWNLSNISRVYMFFGRLED